MSRTSGASAVPGPASKIEPPSKIKPELEGVPETLLWTLYHRALEAARPDAVLSDPKAIELVAALDYPFLQRLGDGGLGAAQGQALRSLSFDAEVRRFLVAHPDATVVALGEGLETQFFRVDNGRVRWVSVDLPQIAELRRRLLPEASRTRIVGCSALDPRWIEQVDASRPVLVTAQGLLMYLQPEDVRALLANCARSFPEGALLFDAIPTWFSALTKHGLLKISEDYPAPIMPWALSRAERKRLGSLHPNIAEVSELPLARGRGLFFGYVLPLMYRTPWLKRYLAPLTVLVRLAATGVSESSAQ